MMKLGKHKILNYSACMVWLTTCAVIISTIKYDWDRRVVVPVSMLLLAIALTSTILLSKIPKHKSNNWRPNDEP